MPYVSTGLRVADSNGFVPGMYPHCLSYCSSPAENRHCRAGSRTAPQRVRRSTDSQYREAGTRRHSSTGVGPRLVAAFDESVPDSTKRKRRTIKSVQTTSHSEHVLL
eukprot:214469-Rhodomonas_salina.1